MAETPQPTLVIVILVGCLMDSEGDSRLAEGVEAASEATPTTPAPKAREPEPHGRVADGGAGCRQLQARYWNLPQYPSI